MMDDKDIQEYHNIGRTIKLNDKVVSLEQYKEAMSLE